MQCVSPVRLGVSKKTKKGSLACDEACMAWKSQRFCSIVLAVAEEKNTLHDFLSSYKRSKVAGNYTAVCTRNQPKNVGKKPGGSKRKGPSQYSKPVIDSVIDPLCGSTEKKSNTNLFT